VVVSMFTIRSSARPVCIDPQAEAAILKGYI
jgi:hypothetical protein